MSAFVVALGLTLMPFAWQGLLIGGAAAVGLALLRNRRAEYRYLLVCSALLACLAWPLFDLCRRLLAGGDGVGAAGAITLAVHNLAGTDARPDLRGALRAAVSAWALCAALLALRMGAGLLWIGRAARQQAPRQRAERSHWQAVLERLARGLGVTRPVRLTIVDKLDSPVTAGWWRPVVLLPAALVSGMPPELLEALLAHEMAHIKRHDYLINLLQNAIETLLFYHPAVWWLSNRIRAERELIADALAARQLGEPRRLALALSELEKRQFSTHHLAPAANGGNLMKRIEHLMRPAPQALNWKAALPMLGLAAACLSIYAQATAADASASATKAVPAAVPADHGAVADFSRCAKPAWPEAALASKAEGRVTLRYLVSNAGVVKDSAVATSSGRSDLDEAARTAIAKCPFTPAIKDGKPVEAWVALQYVWVAG